MGQGNGEGRREIVKGKKGGRWWRGESGRREQQRKEESDWLYGHTLLFHSRWSEPPHHSRSNSQTRFQGAWCGHTLTYSDHCVCTHTHTHTQTYTYTHAPHTPHLTMSHHHEGIKPKCGVDAQLGMKGTQHGWKPSTLSCVHQKEHAFSGCLEGRLWQLLRA